MANKYSKRCSRPYYHEEKLIKRVLYHLVFLSLGFLKCKPNLSKDWSGAAERRGSTFESASHLLLPLVGDALRLLAGFAVQVFAAQAGLTAQLGNSRSGQPLFLQARLGPGTTHPRTQVPRPQPSANPRPPKPELKHPYHPERRFHVGAGKSAGAACATQPHFRPQPRRSLEASLKVAAVENAQC